MRRWASFAAVGGLGVVASCGAFQAATDNGNDAGTDGRSDAGVDAIVLDATRPTDAGTEASVDASNDADANPMRVPCTGKTCATYAANLPGVTYVAADDTSVAWSNFGDGTVAVCPTAGCAMPVTLDTGVTTPSFVSLTPTKVYWATSDGVHVSPRTISNPTLYASAGQPVGGVATTGETVYFTYGSFVCRDLCNSVYLGGFSGLTAIAIAPNVSLVFAVSSNGIYQMSANLNDGTQFLFAPDSTTFALATDGQAVFWIDPSSTASMYKQPIGADGAAPKPVVNNLDQPWGLVLDATDVYYTTVEGGTVARVSRGGGTPTILAKGLTAPKGIAQYGTDIFVAVSGENRIVRISKNP
jgi:hypothetical protein